MSFCKTVLKQESSLIKKQHNVSELSVCIVCFYFEKLSHFSYFPVDFG